MADDMKGPPAEAPDPRGLSRVPPRSRRKGRGPVIWGVVILIFALAFLLVLRRHEEARKAVSPARGSMGIAVTTATAQKGDIGVYLDAIGTVTPIYTDLITSQVNGLVVAVQYREGQRVRKGDPLVDIDSRPYRALLLQAQGVLERDENVLAQARMDLERYRAAWARNAIAKQILDDQEKLVLQDEGMVKNDLGTVQFDQIQVDYCHITSPIAGRVGLRLVDPGNVIQSAGTQTLAVVTQLEPITVIFTIPEDSLGQVQARLRRGAKLPSMPSIARRRRRSRAAAADPRQPDRHDDRDGQRPRALRQQGRRALPEPVRQYAPAGRYAAGGDADSCLGRPAERHRIVRLRDSEQQAYRRSIKPGVRTAA